ncbi:hypothetical protein RKD48_005164 [Streptomyces ambofaciens]
MSRPGEEELVLHDAVLDALGLGETRQFQSAVEAGGRRLLGVDVLARGDRLPDRLLAGRGHLGVEVEVDGVVGEDRVEVRGDVREPVPLRQRPQGVLAAADQDRLRPQHGAVAEVEAALFAQRQDGADEVLAVAHAPGHTVHGDTHRLACHVIPFVRAVPSRTARRTSRTASAFYVERS